RARGSAPALPVSDADRAAWTRPIVGDPSVREAPALAIRHPAAPDDAQAAETAPAAAQAALSRARCALLPRNDGGGADRLREPDPSARERTRRVRRNGRGDPRGARDRERRDVPVAQRPDGPEDRRPAGAAGARGDPGAGRLRRVRIPGLGGRLPADP